MVMNVMVLFLKMPLKSHISKNKVDDMKSWEKLIIVDHFNTISNSEHIEKIYVNISGL